MRINVADGTLSSRVASRLGRRTGIVERRLFRGDGTAWPYCNGCPLNDGRPKIPSSGNIDTAKVAVVGEKPGEAEVERGEAWVGRAGSLLRDSLKRDMGIDPTREAFLGNVVRCRPRQDELSDGEMLAVAKRCSAYVMDELESAPSLPIVGTGNLVLRTLSGVSGIIGERGILRRLPDGRRFLPTHNPAYILWTEGAAREQVEAAFRSDLASFGRWLRNGSASVVGEFVKTERRWKAIVSYMESRPLVFFDFETPGLSPWGMKWGVPAILSGGFSTKAGESFGVAIVHPDAPFSPDVAAGGVRAILGGQAEKGGLHIQHDIKWARWAGWDVRNVRADAMLAATLLAYKPYTEIKSNLLRLASDWLGEIEYPWLHVNKARMTEYPIETIVGMAMTDAEWELRIHAALLTELEERSRVVNA